MDAAEYIRTRGLAARAAAAELALTDGARRDAALASCAAAIRDGAGQLRAANKKDLARADEFGLTAAMVVATIAMLFGGLAAAAMVQGVLPGVVASVYNSMMYYAGGAVLAAVIAAAVTFLLVKRSD